MALDGALTQLIGFSLILLRVSAILFAAPIFSSENVPPSLKIGMAVAFTFAIAAALPLEKFRMPLSFAGYLPAAISELTIGLTIGYAARLIFAAVQLSGQLMGLQMGFGIANIIDPMTNIQVPVLSQFQNLFAVLIFLSANAHYWFIKALVASFHAVPLYGLNFGGDLLELLLRLSGSMFLIALKIGAPVIAASMIASMALGLLAKTVPQLNIFIISMPLNTAIGIVVLGFSLPFLAQLLFIIFEELGQDILAMINLMGR